MSSQARSPIGRLRTDLNRVKTLVSKSRVRQIRSKPITEEARNTVNHYFDEVRPDLMAQELDNESLGGLDTLIQELLVLAQKASLKKSYEQKIKSINQELDGVEVSLVATSTVAETYDSRKLDGKELRIAETLYSLVPSASVSYEQACRDLREPNRLSFRGAAAELREALREVLDHLAPDEDVMSQEGFKLEKEQKNPTMKQKVRYILKSRGKSKTISETPEQAVQVVEERVGALARSVYTRSSISTHVGTTREEVQQIKAYVDVVLSELLVIV